MKLKMIKIRILDNFFMRKKILLCFKTSFWCKSGYFNKFNFNSMATYRCLEGRMSPAGRTLARVGWVSIVLYFFLYFCNTSMCFALLFDGRYENQRGLKNLTSRSWFTNVINIPSPINQPIKLHIRMVF